MNLFSSASSMNVHNPHRPSSQALSLEGTKRWDAYQRLQELDVICSCQTNEPLRVALQTPTDLIQLWSVARRITASRPESLDWLTRCWTAATANKIQ